MKRQRKRSMNSAGHAAVIIGVEQKIHGKETASGNVTVIANRTSRVDPSGHLAGTVKG